jgi:ubiquinol-cytochrome c reductase cytochrome c subunit
MSSRLRVLAAVWLPLLVLSGVAGTFLSRTNGVTLSANSGPNPSGQILYQEDCAACHGSDGRGTVRAPSLAGVGEAAVDFELTTGRMPKRGAASRQPPYTATLPVADITALDRYVTALVAAGGPAVPNVDPTVGDVAKGQQLWNEYCAACHGWAGAGGIMFDRPVPKVTEATPTQIGEAMRVGPAQMPVFGPQVIPPAEVNAIAAYLRQVQHPADRGGDSISHLGPVAEGAVIWLIGMVLLLFAIRWIGERG